jgi:hypothetical protein
MTHRKTVSAEYLMGIREGRELFDRSKPDLAMMREFLASTIATAQEFSAGPVKDMLKGERDFWRHRIKLEIEKNSRK